MQTIRDLPDVEYEKFWRRLQQIGLNAYEARSYLVLVGHPRFKALELAARAQVRMTVTTLNLRKPNSLSQAVEPW